MEQVPVVLRVRLVRQGEGSKYVWPEFELLAVLKNDSNHVFPRRFEAAVYGSEPHVPSGVSTLYLERYNPQHDDHWRLLAGSVTMGMSDTTIP